MRVAGAVADEVSVSIQIDREAIRFDSSRCRASGERRSFAQPFLLKLPQRCEIDVKVIQAKSGYLRRRSLRQVRNRRGRGSEDGFDFRVLEHSAGEQERLVESDGDDQEGQRFGKLNQVDGDVQEVCREEGEEEAEYGGYEGGAWQPERASHLAHVQEKSHKRQMHQDIAEHDDKDVGAVGILGQDPETGSERSNGVGEPFHASCRETTSTGSGSGKLTASRGEDVG